MNNVVNNHLLFNSFKKNQSLWDLNQIPFSKFLGYFISHNGEVSGSTITNNLREFEGKSWCNPPKDSELSVENHIYNASVTFITSYCSRRYTDQALSDCMDLSSLSVKTKSSVVSPLEYSLIMALVGWFFFAVFSMILSCRLAIAKKNCLKRHKEALLQNQITS